MTSIGQSIEAVCAENGLDRNLIIDAMKEAVKAAARKQFKAQDKTGDTIQVDWNDADGTIEISAQKTVVASVENPTTELSLTEAQELAGDEIEIGDMLLLPLPTEDLGRIAAQTAKQILVQKVREAIREKVYDEYIERKGELVNGTVKRFERGDMIIDLGGNLEAGLSKKEQVRSENWNQGERIRVVISDITKDPKGPQIQCSRASADLLKRLFEMEVPEIYDETVIIKSAVREPGDRAKIAVASNEKDVDPVGACVGMKGSRVQSIIKELRGEKIDIIEWSDEPAVFAANALSPAKVSQVRITDVGNHDMEVIVIEDQLSLAIGKRGQNVRLATRLVGWNINIVSEEVLKKEVAQQMGKLMASGEAVPVSALEGVSNAQADDLKEKGITDVERLAVTSVDDLVDILDISLDEAEKIITSAQAVVVAKNAASGGENNDAPDETNMESAQVSAESHSTETKQTETESSADSQTKDELSPAINEISESGEDSQSTVDNLTQAQTADAPAENHNKTDALEKTAEVGDETEEVSGA